jgi:hypothetical protein
VAEGDGTNTTKGSNLITMLVLRKKATMFGKTCIVMIELLQH